MELRAELGGEGVVSRLQFLIRFMRIIVTTAPIALISPTKECSIITVMHT